MKLTEYRGIEISVQEDGIFYCEQDSGNTFSESFKKLKDRIDDNLKATAKKETVHLPVIRTKDCSAFIVTGIHLGTGLVLPTQDRHSYSDIIPDTPINRELVKQLIVARERLSNIEGEIYPRRVTARYGYGRISSDEYPATIKALKDNYQAALEESQNYEESQS